MKTDDDGALAGYTEKPEYHYRVSMGVNVFEPGVLEFIEEDETLGIPDLMLRLKDAGKKVMTFESPCLWFDIGRREDYDEAVDVFEERRGEFLGESGP